MRILVTSPQGLHHFAAGLQAWGPGEYDFPDNPLFAGWLQGQVERGAVQVLTAADPAPVNDPADVLEPIRCTGQKGNGEPCSAWALEGSDRCRHHPRKEGAA
jgi:hypothetical protein